MTADVLDFRARGRNEERTLVGAARCHGCGHRWTAQVLAGAVWLECPACGADKGRMNGAVSLAEDREFWRCPCGSEAFALCRDEWVCYGCGKAQRFPA